MKTGLRMHLKQGVSMTPQLVQSIRLLQLSAPELEQEILSALERNVMLERCEESEGDADAAPDLDPELADAPVETQSLEVDWDAALSESWERRSAPAPERGGEPERAAPENPSPHLRALRELDLSLQSPLDARIATLVVENIDENGYLERPLAELRDTFEIDVALSDFERVLGLVQQLDPPGFGARDLRECLFLQLRALDARTPGRALALWLVSQHFAALGAGDFVALDEQLDPAPELLHAALHLIHRLDPKPAATESATADYVVPDLTVRRGEHGWKLELNRAAAPRVRVNDLYEGLLNQCKKDGANLREQLQEARWLVRGLEMRQDTLLRAGRVIFERQREFLERGDEGMKPLTLKEVATAIGMHESTVSRITTRKYVQTPRGVFELKYFFASQLAGVAGVEASGTAVKAMIRRLVDGETAGRPLDDATLAALLARNGIRIARRTVAKYREALGIPSAKQRLQAPLAQAV